MASDGRETPERRTSASCRACFLWRVCAASIAAGLACEASTAVAQDAPATGATVAVSGDTTRATIVSIDRGDVFIDLGGADLRPEQTFTVYRGIVVRHPVTRAALRDRFAIGRVVVRQVGQKLSLTQAAGEPTRPFEVGDVVEAPRAAGAVATSTPVASATASAANAVAPVAQAAPAARAASTTASAPMPAMDRETDELLRYWRASLGKPPEERAGLYRAFLARWPLSRHDAAIRQEIVYLTEQQRAVAVTADALEDRTVGDATGAVAAVARVRHARAGEAIDLAGAYDTRRPPHRLVVFVRGHGEPDYHALAMRLDGRGHARVRIEGSDVRTPGIDYFVEAVSADGRPVQVAGSATHPLEVEVFVRGDRPEPVEAATRVRFSSELVSFDSTSGDDFFLVNEGDFFHRLDLGVLHGFRMGYGHFLGQGGKLDTEGKTIVDPDPAGFSYGFFEGEFSLARLFGLAGRVTLGLGRPEDASERDGITGGFQLRARIGTAMGTRLILAGEVLPEIGQRAFLGLQWSAGERVPMSTEVHVTDQPVNSDELAVRLVQEIGYRFGDRFTLALRPSYQLRTIRHAGPGIGLAATFDW